MSEGKPKKTSLKQILLRTAFILVGVAVFAVGSFSLAKYVSSEEAESAAGVAGLGIKVFELQDGSLSANIDYTQVVPGADIPAPRISLHLESEVGYTLYLKVTEGASSNAAHDWKDPEFAKGNAIYGQDGEGRTHKVVSYTMAPCWYYVASELRSYTENGMTYNVKYYQYNLAADGEHDGDDMTDDEDFMFKPATEYNYTALADGMIQILTEDAIIISQYYGVRANPPKFSLAFEAYIRQTLG